jgi:hypothetical protein
LSEEEQQQLNDLITLLVGFSLCPDRPNSWRWIPGTTCIFSIKSYYSFLLETPQAEAIDADVLDAIKNLWRNDLPSKVLVFGWRLLLERLPTRGALHHRGILANPNDLLCIFCLHHIEDCEHLFFNCPFIKRVWEMVYHCIGRSVVTRAAVVNGRHHFFRFGNLFRYPKGGRVSHLIWLATTCVCGIFETRWCSRELLRMSLRLWMISKLFLGFGLMGALHVILVFHFLTSVKIL